MTKLKSENNQTEKTKKNEKVRLFREILIWPVRISMPWKKQRLDKALALLTSNDSPWKPIENPILREDGKDKKSAYTEFVYFHPFVQKFLYGEDSPIRIAERKDITSVKVKLNTETESVTEIVLLEVAHIHLYLFDTQIAILVLEIKGSDFPLSTVQSLQNQFRRVYPPYWDDKDAAGHCPSEVTWLDNNGDAIGESSNYNYSNTFISYIQDNKTPPVAAHWRWLLQPLHLTDENNNNKKSVSFSQILDERIPAMTYLAVDNPFKLSRNDLIRLTFYDESGKSEDSPYATKFLSDFEQKHCYDRFWEPQNAAKDNWMTTRYMCCGYGFVVIGKANNKFFLDEDSGLHFFFGHHYFQFGLILDFQRASLLVFTARLAEAANRIKTMSNNSFMKEIQNIHEDFVQFTHRYWFLEISNQLQGKELFNWWKKHLGMDELYQQVIDEVRESDQLLDNRHQQKQNNQITRLTWIASIALSVGLSTSFLGMNIIITSNSMDLSRWGGEWGLFAITTFIAVLVLSAVYLITAVWHKYK